MKRYFIIILGLLFSWSSQAVLKEKDLEQTLSVLRSELEHYYQEKDGKTTQFSKTRASQRDRIVQIMKQSEQVALMLYSQRISYTFDLAYSCHEATSLYDEFTSHQIPFNKILEDCRMDIERYEYIIEVLEKLPPMVRKEGGRMIPDSIMKKKHLRMNEKGDIDTMTTAMLLAQRMDSTRVKRGSLFRLSEQGQKDRDSCVILASEIRESMIGIYNSIAEDSEYYEYVANKLKKMNDYAVKRYTDIQKLIFRNGDDSYFKILQNFPDYWRNAKNDFVDKYLPPANNVRSDWRGPIVFALSFFIIFYLVLATLLSNVIIRFILPERFKTKAFNQKKFFIILSVSIVLFAVVMSFLRGFMYHNFFLMASRLLIEYSALVGAVLFSLLIRVNGSQIKSAFSIYTPILLMGFIVIVFRIIFISNSVVNFIFPPILLLFTLWQWYVVKSHRRNIPFYDIAYAFISLAVISFSCVASWLGYTLLAVQIFIWWLFQLTLIQTLTCLSHILKQYEFRYLTSRTLKNWKSLSVFAAARKAAALMHPDKKQQGEYIIVTWFYDLCRMTLLPILSLLSFFISVYMAAGIFDLTETCKTIFQTNFADVKGVCQLSLEKIVYVIILYFAFRFISYCARSVYKKYSSSKSGNNEANVALSNFIISTLCWGTFFLISLILLRIPKSGISIVTAGLATGMGFAMKDILENFVYGLSLMTGRLRVGDYIECDGIRGRVNSINYQSTQVIATDGSLIAFLNSSLFNKNFKNLTRNHAYEFTKLEVGVAYGSDLAQVRKMLVRALGSLYKYEKEGLPSIEREKGIDVIVSDFGDSSVNLYVNMWILVQDKFRISGVAKEIIYNTLNQNNIEIPFPQRTVYIKEQKD